jgi:hypothetical protein
MAGSRDVTRAKMREQHERNVAARQEREAALAAMKAREEERRAALRAGKQARTPIANKMAPGPDENKSETVTDSTTVSGVRIREVDNTRPPPGRTPVSTLLFASPAARDLAAESDLVAEDFRTKPGRRGYTMEQVRKTIERKLEAAE